MIKIIDATLANIDQYEISREQLFFFCEGMKQIGILDMEISTKVYHMFGTLPEGIRFYLRLDPFQKIADFQGIYKYVISNIENLANCISSFQINDSREVQLLRKHGPLDFVKIVGLDDLLCGNYTFVMKEIMSIFAGKEILFCPENTYDCASALAIIWLGLGGKAVTTSFMGIGNLSATEEVYMAMHVTCRYKPNQSLSILQNLAVWYEKITKKRISPIKPIIGQKIFYVESGIHVDGIIKNPANYEAYEPQLVGKETTIVIGKHSGTNSIKLKCNEHGIDVHSQSDIDLILNKVKQICMEKRSGLTDDEFLGLVREVLADERKKMDC